MNGVAARPAPLRFVTRSVGAVSLFLVFAAALSVSTALIRVIVSELVAFLGAGVFPFVAKVATLPN
jgi:hypothetical protein